MTIIQASFFVTADGKLPEGIRQTLSLQIPKYAGKKMRLTFVEVTDDKNAPQERMKL